MKNKDFKSREKKYQKIWERQDWHKAKIKSQKSKVKNGKKFYVLVEFPYPSGLGLHIGHAFTMTGADVFARKKRMDGFNTLFPMGWDAFGLPTENYAIKTGISPQKATKDNTDTFRRQMKEMAFSFDWSREINSTDPRYYRWTQWIFTQLFKYGLAYKEEKAINWCPSCKTGLANEEVVDGKCERCGAEASKKNLSQWIVKITDYADRLIEGLEKTDFIPKVKAAQINWIGKSSGVTIDYPIVDGEGVVSCYSTRPDTNFGATFVVIAPEHEVVTRLTTKENRQVVKDYVKQAKRKSELERTELGKDKTGVFTGSYCLNRLTGKKMPIYVADFVVLTAGTGIVVGVPAHDKRDWVFAKKYNLEITPVIKPLGNKNWDYVEAPFVDIDKAEVFNSDFLNGMKALKAKEAIIDYLVKKGWGKRATNYHLRDWIFSRQHYWGEPTPMIYCSECAKKGVSYFEAKNEEGKTKNNSEKRKSFKISEEVKNKTVGYFPVEDKDLPIELPKVEKYQPTDTGESPLVTMTDWVETKCPHCGGKAKRETDTMPNWAGSDWYYLAYLVADKLRNPKSEIRNPKQTQKFNVQNSKQESLKHSDLDLPAGRQEIRVSQDIFSQSKNILDYWLPIDVYVGGDEHNTLHLLYSRFIYQFLWDIGVMPEKYLEPYYRRISHGVILGPDGQRMSKSRGNIVVPDQICAKYGVDVVRTYLMFIGPFEATMIWNEKALKGVSRFLNKFKNLVLENSKSETRNSKQIQNSNNQNSKQIKTEEDKDTSKVGFAPVLSEVERSFSDGSGELKQIKVAINKLVKKVGEDVDTFQFNTAIATMMKFVNQVEKNQWLMTSEQMKKLTKLLAPFAPYLAEELWQELGGQDSVHQSNWPKVDLKYLIEDEVEIVVQVNGTLRSKIKIQNSKVEVQKEVEEKAKKDPRVAKYLEGKKIVKTVFVLGRLVNFVVK